MKDQTPFEAEIVHDLPDDISATIGRVMVTYAKIEHKLSMLASLILQLNKAEARIALRMPRATDRLDMVLDLFAIRAIIPVTDTVALSKAITKATSDRDMLAHSLWLRHPKTGELFIRLTRGNWPKDLTNGGRITRSLYPQSIPFDLAKCQSALAGVERTLVAIDALGAELDEMLRAFPERFRPPAPLLNPLGSRTPSGKQRPPEASPGSTESEE